MNSALYESFLQLVKLGIGTFKSAKISKDMDWSKLKALADAQGLSAIILDALNTENLNLADGMPLEMKLEWIGEVLQNYEGRYTQYKKAIGNLASFYNQHGFKMMVLKGYACSLNWPKPEHRPTGDIDIWQFGQQKGADAALVASSIFQDLGSKIDNSHHHHTVFEWQGFTVENHYDFVNVHAEKSSKELEKVFKELGKDDAHFVELYGEKVYLPAPNLHALFLIRHMVSHFVGSNITLRQVLDWAFFVGSHSKEIDWKWLVDLLEKYHMRDFFNCINAICVEELGFPVEIFRTVQFVPDMKERVLKDIVDPAYATESPRGLIRRMAYKYKRWKGNSWKQELCYYESRWSMFWTGIRAKLLKPASI